MNTALAAVLARPDIWRGDTIAVSPAPTLATGFSALDAELPGGGWPRGHITELLSSDEGVGEWSLLMPALAHLTGAGQRVVLVLSSRDPRLPHAPGWTRTGVDLDRFIIVRPASSRDVQWAAVEALRCADVAATVLWPDSAVRQSAGTTLRRLQSAAGDGGGCGFLLRPAACAVQSSPAPLRLLCASAQRQLRVDVLKRRGCPAPHPLYLDIRRPAGRCRTDHALAGLRSVAAPAESRFSLV